MAATTIRRLQARLDTLALEQLRQVAAQQQARIESLEQRLADALESCDFWRDRADSLLEAIQDADFHTAMDAAAAAVADPRFDA